MSRLVIPEIDADLTKPYLRLLSENLGTTGKLWREVARDKQLPPEGDWWVWLILTGRGWGKTRTGAEFIREKVERGEARNIALVGRTVGDVRQVMVEGPSGLLAVCPEYNRPRYEPSKRKLSWPNGAIAWTYSAEEPDQLRGPEHDLAWADELASWKTFDAWDNLGLGLRIGASQTIVTTTPKPVSVIRELYRDRRKYPSVHITEGSTYENIDNLSPSFRAIVLARYEGTRLGEQELEGKLLEDIPGALWTLAMIADNRVEQAPSLVRIVVAMDPAVTSTEEANEMGIVVAGVSEEGQGYVLEDLSVRASPKQAAEIAIGAYEKHTADRIVAEVNNGGEWIEEVIRAVDPSVAYKSVHASRGKRTRAEPIAALYEQGKVHHVWPGGKNPLELLEDQMCTYVPGDKSPDRMDALVWALTELDLAVGVHQPTVFTGASFESYV